MTEREPGFRDRLTSRPSLKLANIAKARPRELGIRFIAGALTSIAAGAITIAFGPRVGGIMLAFPAILAASLTLIEEQEDSVSAREDARGATVGGCGMAAFAGAGALLFGAIGGGLALLIAAAVWLGVAVLGYVLLWLA